jgi:hypothetical protein
LKLLAALFRGRFALVNSPMVANTGLESLCVIGETAPGLKSQLLKLFTDDFQEAEIEKRKSLLAEKFSNKRNAEKITAFL